MRSPRLKGLPPRPKFKGKPSGMEKATSKPLGGKGKGRKPGRGSKRDKLTVTTEVKVKAFGVPSGSRFRGYEDVTVQDLHNPGSGHPLSSRALGDA